MAANLACDKFWVNKIMYHDAEKKYQENLAKPQRRLEISGGKMEERSNKKILKRSKKIHNDVNINELRKELFNLEALENEKDRTCSSKMYCFDLIKKKEEQNCRKVKNIIDNENKNRNKERPKDVQENKNKNKNEKKSKRTKENIDDLVGSVGLPKTNQDTIPKTSGSGEVPKTLQNLKTSLEFMEKVNGVGSSYFAILEKMEKAIENLTKRVEAIEKSEARFQRMAALCPSNPPTQTANKQAAKEDEDDDVDLFGSDSEEENEEAKKIREQRLAEYAEKKSKKPAPVAKSNIILDIKPWDDETDMAEMEKAVRSIEMDGLVWGASKLVPVAFKIFKLQISCVIEDDKVSVDLLTEKLEEIENYIQSVDIAAFNKV